MSNPALLAEAERVLRKHSPDAFATSVDAAPECIEYVFAIENEGAWKSGYPSLDAFYAAHEARHPCVRVYAAVRREINTADPLHGPGATIAERIERHCRDT